VNPVDVELVVLLDEAGGAIGTAPKASVHHASTPLHLAFSCYVFDTAGRLLVTQRALSKPTFPGVWTNTVCGHPAPGEDIQEAVRRRARDELGITLDSLTLVLPRFRYTATMADGVRENELCPVFTATTADQVRPDAAEVEAFEWVPWADFRDEVLAGIRAVSSWCAEQVPALAAVELGRGGFPEGSTTDLPAAARPAGR
jgi:isopentenyl-diphosphate Delta-isomerase